MTQTVTSTFTFEPPQEQCDVQDVCTWLLRVMDKKDKSVVFVASIMTFFLQKGGISEKQYSSLSRVYDRVLETYGRNALAVQGSVVAEDDGTPANIVKFTARRSEASA